MVTTKHSIQYWHYCISFKFCSIWWYCVVVSFLSVEDWNIK